MHDAAFTYFALHVPRPRSDLVVLEFGARNINGSVRESIGDCKRYVGVDISDGPGVDLIADAATVEVPGRFDVVVCAEVFEHAPSKQCAAMVGNAYAHLKVGGTFVATMAGPNRAPHSAVDGGPVRDGEYYRNVERSLLEEWLTRAGFEFEIDEAGDDLRCTARKTAKKATKGKP